MGIVSFAVDLAPHSGPPGPDLWLALLLGLLVAEVVSNLAVTVLMRLLGVPTTRGQLLQPVAFAVVTSVVFTAVSILALTAAWTEPFTLAIVAGLLTGVAFAYRGHRRLQAQQGDTERLHEFLAHLGPLSAAEHTDVVQVLEQVRSLLRAATVNLALVEPGGGWRHVTVTHDGAPSASVLAAAAEHVDHDSRPRLSARSVGDSQQMSTPLYGGTGVIAILSAVDRIGENRDFDMADLRLMETIAAELATALERGRLLADLGAAATTDALTGRPNLIETSRLVDQILATTPGALVAAVAVDSFREVNDTLGHQVGDELLLEVTRRLLAAVPDALVGRIGGGRFAVIVPADGFSGDAELLGLHLRAEVEGGAQLGPIGTHVRLSVGCAEAPEHGTDAETLIRRAETAMYSARHHHGG
ncbi:MAG: sensor domain-containing diguanylate cyclase, partial [Mycobacteriales bacterium]